MSTSKHKNKATKTRRTRRALKSTDVKQASGRKLARVGWGCGISKKSLGKDEE